MLMVGELRFVLKKTASVLGGHLWGQALVAYNRSAWHNTVLNTSFFWRSPGDAYSVYHVQEKVLWTFQCTQCSLILDTGKGTQAATGSTHTREKEPKNGASLKRHLSSTGELSAAEAMLCPVLPPVPGNVLGSCYIQI